MRKVIFYMLVLKFLSEISSRQKPSSVTLITIAIILRESTCPLSASGTGARTEVPKEAMQFFFRIHFQLFDLHFQIDFRIYFIFNRIFILVTKGAQNIHFNILCSMVTGDMNFLTTHFCMQMDYSFPLNTYNIYQIRQSLL